MKRRFGRLAFSLSASLALAANLAVPVRATEDSLTTAPDRPGFGASTRVTPVAHLELELGYHFAFFHHEGTESRMHNIPETLARFGLIDDFLELRLSTDGYQYSRSDDESELETQSGFNDVEVGAKVKLCNQDRYLPSMVLVASTSVGVGSRDVSERDAEPTLELAWALDLGHGLGVSGSGEVTYATTDGERFVQGAGSVLASGALSDRAGVFGEYFLISPNAKHSATANYMDLGVTYLLTNRIQLDATVGWGLNRVSDNFFMEPGISVLF
jgi:hypothetical protein